MIYPCCQTLNNACVCRQLEYIDDTPTNTQDQTELLIFGQDDRNHPLYHTRVKRASLKRILPADKFEEMMRLAYIDDMPPSLNDDDDNENEVCEEGLN